MDLLTNESLLALLEIVGINVVLSGDNAIVIGLAAAGLPAKDRGRVIAVGILAATVLRIIFAVLAESLLEVTGLLVVGGLLLLWVCWKMWR
ncbi:MAG TPA: TerC family protein, partial [Rubellimicrobium sp.]|nr:TerC family protein [Rubellimicrobium sp.]